MTIARKNTLTIHQLRDVVLKLINDRNLNPSSLRAALHTESSKVLHFFSIVGMTPEKLCSTNPDLFGNEYDKTIFKSIKCDIDASTAKDIYLGIQKYGFMPVMYALQLKEASVVEDELKKFGFRIKVYDYASIQNYNDNFFQDMNVILRKANSSPKTSHVANDDLNIKLDTLMNELSLINISNNSHVDAWIQSMNTILVEIFPDTNAALFRDRMSRLTENLNKNESVIENILRIKESAPNNIYLKFLLAAQLQKNKEQTPLPTNTIQTTQTTNKPTPKDIKELTIRDIREAIQKMSPKRLDIRLLAKTIHPYLTSNDLTIMLVTIGMSIKELRSCPREIFGDDYDKPLGIKKIHLLLKPEHKQSIIKLINKYGPLQVANTLGHINEDNLLMDLENKVSLKYIKESFPKKLLLKYESLQFFSDFNEFFRSCDFEIPNYRKKWNDWLKRGSSNRNAQENIPVLPFTSNLGRIEMDKVSLPKNSNVINLSEDSDEEELQTSKKQKRSPSPTLFSPVSENFSPIDRDGLTFDLFLLHENLDRMTKMEMSEVSDWLDQLDAVLDPYFSQTTNEESQNIYVWELSKMMPTFDLEKLHALILTFPEKSNLRMLFNAQMLKEDEKNQPPAPPI